MKTCSRCCRDIQDGENVVSDPCCKDPRCEAFNDVAHPRCIPTIRIVPVDFLI